MLRWSIVQRDVDRPGLHLRPHPGAVGPRPLDGLHHLIGRRGAAPVWNSGDSVVGMP